MSDVQTGITSILEERGKVYGDYGTQNRLRADMMSLIKQSHKIKNNREMFLEHQYMIFDIINKLSRIAVSPDHIDSWADVEGYAKLIKEELLNNGKHDANK